MIPQAIETKKAGKKAVLRIQKRNMLYTDCWFFMSKCKKSWGQDTRKEKL